jgi:probable HAF family extracellular repeat protein
VRARVWALGVAAAVAVVVASAAPALGARYTIRDLGLLRPGAGLTSTGFAVNDAGHVAGQSDVGGGSSHAVLWRGGRRDDLGSLGGFTAAALALNGSDQVVGYSDLPGDLGSHAFLSSGGVMHDLGTLPGGTLSTAYGITRDGRVVGASDGAENAFHAVVWAHGSIRDLNPPGYSESWAFGISGRAIVGRALTATAPFVSQAVLFQNGVHNLGTLGGANSEADAVNRHGQIVGWSEQLHGPRHAFLWQNGVMHDLGSLGGESFATSISGTGVVVGWFHSRAGNQACIWYPNGHMRNLNALIPERSGWVLRQAFGVNGKGQITGYGVHNGKTRAFLLTLTATK